MNYPIKSTSKTLEVIAALREEDVRTVTDVADALEMNKSTVHNHLRTLVEHGYVRERDGEYDLGTKFLSIGGYARKQMPLYQAAEPEMRQLARDTGELTNLMVEEDGMGVHVQRIKGEDALDLDSYTGMRTHLNTTSLGKAILSRMSDERISEVIDRHGLPGVTENTLTDEEALWAEIEDVRDQGYAVDDGERLGGLYCVAAPIEIGPGRYAAISVSAPASRHTTPEQQSAIVDRVCNAANVVQLNIET